MSEPKVTDVTDKSYWCSFWNVAAMQEKNGKQIGRNRRIINLNLTSKRDDLLLNSLIQFLQTIVSSDPNNITLLQ